MSKQGRKILVSKMSFVESSECNSDELFQGFDELYAVTYSHGLSKMAKVMQFFKSGEVIFGYDKLLTKADAMLFANQEYVVNKVCSNKYLQERIQNDEFRLYVLGNIVSHQKIYLMKSLDGRFRTILTSANFSDTAWNGSQLENYVVCDDKACYDVYFEEFCKLRDQSSDMISKRAVLIDEDGENLEELPIVKRVQKDGVVLLDVSESNDTEDIDYGFFIQKEATELSNKLKSAKIKADKKGIIAIKSESVKELLATARKDSVVKKERKRMYPQFVLDYDEKTVSYNGKLFDLHPTESEIENDVRLLDEHMKGFDEFVGDTNRLKFVYWKVLNYMFLSPFIANIRYKIGDADWLRLVPIYLIICGDSDAGKSVFVKLVQKMMFADKHPASWPKQNFFSSQNMAFLKSEVKGGPVMIDELTTTYWKYAPDIVKADGALIEQYLINHPCFVLISNKINSVKPEITKRVIVINPDCRLSKDLAVKNGPKVDKIRNDMGNALYREYVRVMFDRLETFDFGDTENTPDVWKLSSGVLREIFDRFGLLDCLPVMTWQDYIGEKTVAERALNVIRDELSYNREAFVVDEKFNQLKIDFSGHGDDIAVKLVQVLVDELPAACECKSLKMAVTLNLKQIVKYSGIDLSVKKRSIWPWKR